MPEKSKVRKGRINLTLTNEVKKNLKKRDGFNASQFFERHYREKYLDIDAKKKRLNELKLAVNRLEKEIKQAQSKGTIVIEASDRCAICNMFFN
ncbi:unnamed protein product, partial [marine sediment metagenome]